MNSYRHRIWFAFCCLISTSITSFAQYKVACTCVDSINSPSNEFGFSSSVFSGRVLSMSVDTSSSLFPLRVTFQAIQTWKGTPTSLPTISTGLSSASCGVSFHIDSSYLVYAYQWQGKLTTDICRRTRLLSRAAEDIAFLTTVSVDRASTFSGLPTRLQLFQNYPNPANPSTVIRFALPHASHVVLTLHNLIGNQVSVLLDEVRPAGTHDIRVNLSILASGVYVCHLRTNAGSMSSKLVVLK